jgi:nucleotide-binding universal stress UspA family protein
MDIKKMLVAYDGSVGSKKALSWAVGLAGKLQSSIMVVTVVKPPEFSSSVDEVDECFADGYNRCQPLLEKAIVFGKEQGVDLQTKVLYGHPAESLVRYATDNKVDLIVMGTRGMGGFESLIIGSVAQKVVAYSDVPVTITR